MPLSAGTQLGTYVILSSLGAGGMGEVYRARDQRLGRDVAVKVLPEAVASSSSRLARFEREARTVAGLNHPNIVTLFSVEDEAGVRFLTMELVEGQTLSALISPGGLPFERILELAIPLSDALAAAHGRGVVHRDLKPGNVMVTRENRLKILDFGLAKVTDRPSTSGDAFDVTAELLTSDAGRIEGTLPYMAPEQIRGEAADPRSDLFSFGIILYELAAGRRPFTGRTRSDLTASILRDSPQPLGAIRPDIPSDFERVVGSCLEKVSRNRTRTAMDICAELRALHRAVEHGVPERSIPSPPSRGNVASVAVLPFVNRSASADDEYFSDGLAEELLAVLAKIKGLRVSARSSSFHFKGKNASLEEIGATLNVATVLEGSVRKSGNRVRISVQLVNVQDGYHLWSETYDRTLEDIFAVQDDIAHSVVKELRVALLGAEADSGESAQAKAEVAKAAKGRGTHPEAHRLFLLARHFINRWTREDITKGIGYLKQALEMDPQFAQGWVELAGAFTREAGRGWVATTDGYERAREAVMRAISLEPDLAEAHSALGWIRLIHDWDWKGADECTRKALALAPGNAIVVGLAGALASIFARHEEAIALFRQAIERSPLAVAAYNNLGQELIAVGQFQEAEGAYRKGLEVTPQTGAARGGLALALLAQGRTDEALAEAMREPEAPYRLWAMATIHHAMGRELESRAALDELIEIGAQDNAFQIAEVTASRGEVDAAFGWLERAYVQRDSGLAETLGNPHLRSLHGDPRWSAFLRKMGLE